MRRPLVAGNWKMNGSKHSVAVLLKELIAGCEQVQQAELVVFPPFIFLQQCQQALLPSQICWGAQNLSNHVEGAFTGEISAAMLHDFNCRYVIVGHSERRILHGETNELVAAKFKAALISGIRPILCVGETESQRDQKQTLSVVLKQLAAVLDLHDNLAVFADAVIAYEPLWAIGTGKHATPEQVQEVHAAIREQLYRHHKTLADNVRVLYGGSVKPDNAGALFDMPDIDGVLVGGASLNAKQFLEIGRLCNN